MNSNIYVQYYNTETLEPEPTEDSWSSLVWLMAVLKENHSALQVRRVSENTVLLGADLFEKDSVKPSKHIRITLYQGK